jgi:hypothetical protein
MQELQAAAKSAAERARELRLQDLRTAAGARLAPPVIPLNQHQAHRFMETVAKREANAQRPGVMFDRETGLTYDGHGIDPKTGELVGTPRNWSAASKESLDITFLVKALQGDRIAELAIGGSVPGGDAKAIALDRLRRKIDSYASFNERYPGFGGFLPWFQVDGKPGERRMAPVFQKGDPDRGTPANDWRKKAPALDNGQLAWSIYHAERTLRSLGYTELAGKYRAQLNLMRSNVVKMFYDPTRGALRAEARALGSMSKPPKDNEYENNKENNYYLEDSAEGMAMVHFADLFGHWNGVAGPGRAALWSRARREPATFTTEDGKRVTVVKGWRFSSHEDWAFMILPIRDVPIANRLYENAQRVRTTFAAEGELPGLFASATLPQTGDGPPEYENAMGIASVALPGTEALPVFAPYAAFPLALMDKPMFATWLKNMLVTPNTFGKNGIGESFRKDGKGVAPVLTWDGKVLPLVAYSGGIADEVRKMLKADGLYDRFMETVRGDYRSFEGRPIEGTNLPLRAPTASVPSTTKNFNH